jgi:hypothetical protein
MAPITICIYNALQELQLEVFLLKSRVPALDSGSVGKNIADLIHADSIVVGEKLFAELMRHPIAGQECSCVITPRDPVVERRTAVDRWKTVETELIAEPVPEHGQRYALGTFQPQPHACRSVSRASYFAGSSARSLSESWRGRPPRVVAGCTRNESIRSRRALRNATGRAGCGWLRMSRNQSYPTLQSFGAICSRLNLPRIKSRSLCHEARPCTLRGLLSPSSARPAP